MGVEFNAQMETSRLGIAALVASYSDYEVGGKKVADQQVKFNAALTEATKIQKQLQVAAIETTSTYGEMLEGLQIGMGPLVQAGVPIGKTVQVVQQLTQAMGGLGIPMHQLGIEIRQFVSGDFARGRLLQALGVTPAELEAAKQAGKLVELIADKTKNFAAAGKAAAGTFSGLMSNVKDAFQQIAGEGTKGLFENLKGVLGDVLGNLVEIKRQGEDVDIKFNPVVLDALKTVSAVISEVVTLLSQTFKSVWGDATRSVEEGGQTWTDVFVKIGGWLAWFLDKVAAGAQAIGYFFTHPLETIEGFWKTMLQGIATLLADFLEGLGPFGKKVSDSLGLRGLADKLGDSEGVRNFQKKIDEIGQRSEANGERVKHVLSGIASHIVEIGKDLDGNFKDKAKSALEAQILAATKAYNSMVAYAKGVRQAADAWDKFQPELLNAKGDKFAAELERFGDKVREVSGKVGNAIFANLINVDEGRRVIDAAVTAMSEEFIQKFQGTFSFAALQARIVFNESSRRIAQAAFTQQINPGEAQRFQSIASFERDTTVVRAFFDEFKEGKEAVLEGFRAMEMWGGLPAGFHDLMQSIVGVDEAAKKAGETSKGLVKAIREYLDTIPTQAEALQNVVGGIGQNLTNALDDTFFKVMTGKVREVGDVFKQLGQDILRTMSGYFTDIVKDWLKKRLIISENGQIQIDLSGQSGYTGKSFSTRSYNADGSVSTASGNGQLTGLSGVVSGVAGVLGAAGQGYATGSAVGGASGAPGWATGANIGGTLGGVIGTYVFPGIGTALGALIGAIVGGIVGALTAPNTEQRIHEMTAEAMRKLNVAEQIGAGITDIFRAAHGDTNKAMEEYTKQLHKYASGSTFDVYAGSREDLEKNMKWVNEVFLPRLALQAAFGQKGQGFMPPGSNKMPGGVGGFEWWSNQFMTDYSGTLVKGQLYDENAVIPQLLKGLGFTADKIGEIAKRVSEDDPKKVLEYIKNLVSLVYEFGELRKQFEKTGAENFADFAKEARQSDAAPFADRIYNIKSLAEDLGLYRGEEQAEKGKELLDLINQARQAEIEALKKIYEMSERFAAEIRGDLDSISQLFETADERRSRLVTAMNSSPGAILNAPNAQAALTEAEKGRSAILELLKDAVAWLQNARAAQAAVKDTLEDISAYKANTEQFPKQLQTVTDFSIAIGMVWKQVGDAAKMSGTEQLSVLQRVGAQGKQVFGALVDFIEQVRQTVKQIHDSIADQVFGMEQSVRTPEEQVNPIKDRIEALQRLLAQATDPQAAANIASQIQQLVSQYFGLFGSDDPNRNEALAWAKTALEATQKIADEALSRMDTAANEWITTIQTALTETSSLLSQNETAAAIEIGNLSWALQNLNATLQTALMGAADTIVFAFNSVAGATATAVNALTTLGASLVGDGSATGNGSNRGGRNGIVRNLDDASEAVNNFANSLRNATPNGGGGSGTGDGSGSGGGGASSGGSGRGGRGELNINVNVTGNAQAVAAAVAKQVFTAVQSTFQRTPEAFLPGIG